MFTWMWTKRFAKMANRLQALEAAREENVLSTDLSVQTLTSAPDFWQRQQEAFCYVDRQIQRVNRRTRTWGAMALLAVLADGVLVVAGLSAFQAWQQHHALGTVTELHETLQPTDPLETAIQDLIGQLSNQELSPQATLQARNALLHLMSVQSAAGGPAFMQQAVVLSATEARILAIQELGQAGALEAVGPLTQLLDNGQAIIRLAAAEALGNIGDPAAMDAMHQQLLSETHPEVRRALFTALSGLAQVQG